MTAITVCLFSSTTDLPMFPLLLAALAIVLSASYLLERIRATCSPKKTMDLTQDASCNAADSLARVAVCRRSSAP